MLERIQRFGLKFNLLVDCILAKIVFKDLMPSDPSNVSAVPVLFSHVFKFMIAFFWCDHTPIHFNCPQCLSMKSVPMEKRGNTKAAAVNNMNLANFSRQL